ncbi:uncharacterized protein PgNI_07128 [Pyricularia grisea]|uniref:Uncharacterized protein n=1 Tax=Pyricularia grisea TaxID=148305 RepID=A0A6P8B372_PYRGI|nr:uncharacterized protein PgNI_07128 [Pyricularia grisea]TLD09316.1 hypothetical protein PgNI_07128 [Pyricularia grisea]
MQFTIQKTFFAALAIGLLPSAFAGECVSYTGSCPSDKPHCMWTSGATKICCPWPDHLNPC